MTKTKAKKTESQKLAAVQARLRRGDFTTIAQRTGYDSSHVSRVLSGERKNPSGEILKIAYSLVGRRKA